MKPNIIAISSVFILFVTIFLLFELHDSTKREVLDKFKAQQLFIAKLLSKKIESCLRDESWRLYSRWDPGKEKFEI